MLLLVQPRRRDVELGWSPNHSRKHDRLLKFVWSFVDLDKVLYIVFHKLNQVFVVKDHRLNPATRIKQHPQAEKSGN